MPKINDIFSLAIRKASHKFSSLSIGCIHLFVKESLVKTYPLSTNGPRQANLVLIAYASSEGSGEPAHPRSLARTFATRSYKQ